MNNQKLINEKERLLMRLTSLNFIKNDCHCFQKLIEDITNDIENLFEDLEEVAKEFNEEMEQIKKHLKK